MPSQTPSLFRIKICGFRRAEDIVSAVAAGVEAIGLNFFPGSRRSVGAKEGKALAQAIPKGVSRVGIFVDPTLDELMGIADACQLDYVQLHGDESPSLVDGQSLPPIIKAVSWRGEDHATDRQHIEQWVAMAAKINLRALLVDAYAPVERGGTGRRARWDLLHPRPSFFSDIPVILAGGLTPGNVAEAIEKTRPYGVDTASGVETEPGVKDPSRMDQFIQQARKGFERVEQH